MKVKGDGLYPRGQYVGLDKFHSYTKLTAAVIDIGAQRARTLSCGFCTALLFCIHCELILYISTLLYGVDKLD